MASYSKMFAAEGLTFHYNIKELILDWISGYCLKMLAFGMPCFNKKLSDTNCGKSQPMAIT